MPIVFEEDEDHEALMDQKEDDVVADNLDDLEDIPPKKRGRPKKSKEKKEEIDYDDVDIPTMICVECNKKFCAPFTENDACDTCGGSLIEL